MTCPVDAPTDHLRQLQGSLVHDVPGSELLALEYLWRSAAEFFRKSGRWLVRVPIPAQVETQISFPNMEVVKVVQVQYGNKIIHERSLANGFDANTRYINNTPDILEFTFEPSMESEAIVAVTLTPQNYNVELALLRYYRQDIINGAASMLMMIGNQDYTDQNRAMILDQKFNMAIDDASSHARKFLGHCREYKGQNTQYLNDSPGKSMSSTPNPIVDDMVLDIQDLRKQINFLIFEKNQQSQRINALQQAIKTLQGKLP